MNTKAILQQLSGDQQQAIKDLIRDICEFDDPSDQNERHVLIDLDWMERKLTELLSVCQPAAPLKQDSCCTWRSMGDDDMPNTYEGTCGIAWTFTEGGIEDNECKYCPRCGGKIAAKL